MDCLQIYKTKKEQPFFYGLIVLLLTFHDTFWSLYGYGENPNERIIILELLLYFLAIYFLLKGAFYGNAAHNFCQMLALEFWYQIVAMLLTFPFYAVMNNFSMEEMGSFFEAPSWFNVLYVLVTYAATGWVAKKIWDFVYRHKNRAFPLMCVILATLDIVGLLLAGWRIICIVFPILLYIMATSLLQQNKNEKQLKEQFQYYQELSENRKQREKEITFIRHDLANHINVMEEMKKDCEGENLLHCINKKNRNFTGIPVLDCLIQEKQRVCEKAGITFEKEGSTLEGVGLTEYELVSLFSNLLDNAIEAAGQTAEKKMNLEIKRQQGFFIITVENTKKASHRPIDNEFKTTKKDQKIHGFGSRIVRDIVEVKGGRITYQDEGNSMSVKVLIETEKRMG